MTGRRYLRYLSQSIRTLDSGIDILTEREDELRAALTGGTHTLTDMPKSKGTSDWTNKVAKLDELRGEINGKIDRMAAMKRELAELIASAGEEVYRLLLRLHYAEYMSWERVAEKMGYSTRQTYRLYDAALLGVEALREGGKRFEIWDEQEG